MSVAALGRYSVRQAETAEEIAQAQALRARCFGLPQPRDQDTFDARSTHMLVHDRTDGALVCCYRVQALEGRSLAQSYAAQFYELSALARFEGKMLELGRFCVAPERCDPDIVRAAWAALTDYVDRRDIKLLFGCSSFAGTETESYLDAFAMLRARHLAPSRWLPRVKAPDVFRYAARLRRKPDLRRAMLKMPPLLRTYLLMGGWVSDHAVVDRQMNTLHVFTGLEIAAIPENRKRLLRALV
ncbi:Ornithine-acyl[acyl carrier protein] N-acyltransferase [Sulfitobacter noctilucae]|uniref:GNAT family N-acetyltransferase n=1 Tax=Sulfitobacter noctilucae TaxID=1342302 RepID=UPI00046914ED|nr:GNAT family N-acyltransferase [Sulfitobacter noctilucae]KIN61271.1 Ornithine-acyl[acyl carrier protein] N-acyltransferase [Sulfitobacter noctilucae]